MAKKPFDDLGELQRAVMEAVWELGEATVHQVRERLRRKKKLAYTTVLSSMQKLERYGWLRHRTEGRSYVYLATRSRQEAGSHSVHALAERVFRGNRLLLFQHLLEDETLSDDELAELRKMIDQRRKETRDG
jgi:predicted transcriptional regulator